MYDFYLNHNICFFDEKYNKKKGSTIGAFLLFLKNYPCSKDKIDCFEALA
jgi:hypothetical protein